MGLVLASKSATRIELLTRASIAFDVEGAGIDERDVEAPLLLSGADPATIASHLADAKALAVSRRRPGDLVLGADQTLGLGPELFVKADDRAGAEAQLARLAGRTHQLHAALSLAVDGSVVWRHLSSASLTVRPLSADSIGAYLDATGDAVLGSVGCYQLEGLGIRLFDRIEGDYFTILGLPMLPLLAELRARGLIDP
ncbi:Maf family protein [Prosthecodimorpha staleyi]|uniref:Nucleoside triphosphate pyrophosphatase n=1 Tax=Prosthecodimorpha staleyi TaxID=2840188 RepID=A0A947GDH5_9HYPH|nr:Maf family protein [Prosthecodimorpha staleyi]MBT9290852.1 Maf family protein [Prosthecodimorpha staleyi]